MCCSWQTTGIWYLIYSRTFHQWPHNKHYLPWLFNQLIQLFALKMLSVPKIISLTKQARFSPAINNKHFKISQEVKCLVDVNSWFDTFPCLFCLCRDMIATGCEDKNVRVYYLATSSDQPLKVFTGHLAKVFHVRWSPLREGILCSGSDDGWVRTNS